MKECIVGKRNLKAYFALLSKFIFVNKVSKNSIRKCFTLRIISVSDGTNQKWVSRCSCVDLNLEDETRVDRPSPKQSPWVGGNKSESSSNLPGAIVYTPGVYDEIIKSHLHNFQMIWKLNKWALMFCPKEWSSNGWTSTCKCSHSSANILNYDEN